MAPQYLSENAEPATKKVRFTDKDVGTKDVHANDIARFVAENCPLGEEYDEEYGSLVQTDSSLQSLPEDRWDEATIRPEPNVQSIQGDDDTILKQPMPTNQMAALLQNAVDALPAPQQLPLGQGDGDTVPTQPMPTSEMQAALQNAANANAANAFDEFLEPPYLPSEPQTSGVETEGRAPRDVIRIYPNCSPSRKGFDQLVSNFLTFPLRFWIISRHPALHEM